MDLRVREQAQKGFELCGSDCDEVSRANAFLRSVEIRGLSRCTLRAYAYDLLVLLRWLDDGAHCIEQLTAADLVTFIASQQDAGAKPRSINRRLTTSRLFFRFCTARELEVGPGLSLPGRHYRGAGRDHALGVHRLRAVLTRKLRVKVPHTLVEPLSPAQVRGFLRSLRRYRDQSILFLMLLCGLRSREVLRLEMDDVALSERQLRVCGKGERERLLPISDMLAQLLEDYLRFERPASATHRLFVVLQGRAKGQAMTAAGLRSLFRWRRRKPWLATANAHRFRHTFGTDMARAGVRLPILQKMMGHADSTTTLQYVALSMSDVAEQYAQAIDCIERRYRDDEANHG